jgi:hypothetical protein
VVAVVWIWNRSMSRVAVRAVTVIRDGLLRSSCPASALTAALMRSNAGTGGAEERHVRQVEHQPTLTCPGQDVLPSGIIAVWVTRHRRPGEAEQTSPLP